MRANLGQMPLVIVIGGGPDWLAAAVHLGNRQACMLVPFAYRLGSSAGVTAISHSYPYGMDGQNSGRFAESARLLQLTKRGCYMEISGQPAAATRLNTSPKMQHGSITR